MLVHGVTIWLLLRAEGLSSHLWVLAEIWAAVDEQGHLLGSHPEFAAWPRSWDITEKYLHLKKKSAGCGNL